MKSLLIASLAFTPAFTPASVTCYWTGNSHPVETVTFQPAIECEYSYLQQQRFWRVFAGGTCPATIEVE